ncbi:MAG: hypothetical protein ACKVOR_08495 [Flavobacteriales bacterium]
MKANPEKRSHEPSTGVMDWMLAALIVFAVVGSLIFSLAFLG